MVKPRVFVTQALPQQVIDMLAERCEVEMNPGRNLHKEQLVTKMAENDAVLVVGTRIDEELCRAAASRCRIFAVYGVGYNHVDVDAATRHGIFVSNTPDAVTAATADLAWALLLATARRIVECDAFVRAGGKEWGLMNLLGTQVSGKTLGILGAGRIGAAMARRGTGFDMRILYTGHAPKPDFEAAVGAIFVDKDTLLRESDFISIHVPLLPSTRHLIGMSELRLMKKTAILVNTARGPVVDEEALVEALQGGVIAGAGLDVFENEPKLAPGLVNLPNVVLAPHVGTSTMETRVEMGALCVRNIFAMLDGKLPPTCLNPEAVNRC